MIRTVLGWIGILLAEAGCLQAASPQSPNPAPPSAAPVSTVINRYCLGCHNDKLKTADLSLSQVNVQNVAPQAAVWEKVLVKLRGRAMPPAGVPRPDNAAYESFIAYLQTELDGAAAANSNPGRPSIHRLNRSEYANAIRDLLGIDIDATSLLPVDDGSYGFDNIGDVLTVSPTLLERYMSAADKISRLAVGDPAIAAVSETYRISPRLVQEDRVSESLPFGSRGGTAIRYYFPLDAEYTVQIRLQREHGPNGSGGTIIGLGEPHQLDIRLDGAPVQQFTVGGGTDHNYKLTADAGLESRFAVKAGTHTIGIAFLNRTWESEDALRRYAGLIQFRRVFGNPDDIPGVDSVTIAGPYNGKGAGDTASRRRIFVCRPSGGKESARGYDDDTCARRILSTLARRAYRRPVTDTDVQTLFNFYRSARRQRGFDGGIEVALKRVLVSPHFLFRIESDPAGVAPGSPYRISDIELASRLSFFLWSSIPDDELLDVAAHGKLKDPVALEQQVRRMLADSRAKALVSNFTGQWLYLRNMQKVVPDGDAFPEFDENLRAAFQQETQLFLESMLREDRSVLDLLKADYTFLNERLARHYGIPDVYGSQFRRVTLTDENRKGLMGQGSILTVTSYASRTSPTLRGKWLLENILGSPPPPPPNNVPSLKDRGDDGKILSVRQQMEQHRKNPACAVCHVRMDPLGFALENFDAIGRWRTTSGAANTPIDSSGVLPDGTQFHGPAELRKILLSHGDEFVMTVTDKLLTYALGRGTEYYDAPAVRKIVREAAPGDYSWSSLILGIVRSMPFQMRRSREP
jgi:uncharacterized protein DUF1592/uncharacterized protein DUF1588/uncharacterized protein DUF1587/uncharacterized protein DUF1585/uncharacterized protein DUF1595